MTGDLWTVRQEAYDPLALRISIGMPHEVVGHKDGQVGYVVYRGDAVQCLNLLEQAAEQLRLHIESEHQNARS